MKFNCLIAFLLLFVHGSFAQRTYFNHLDVSATFGTTGLGVEVSSPLSNMVDLRMGFDAMPHFSFDSNFSVSGMKKDESGQWSEINKSQFERMASLAESITSIHVKDHVVMESTPSLYNFKLLVDVYPFKSNKNKYISNIYFTAGFYLGNSKVGETVNAREYSQSLSAVNIYNSQFERFTVLDKDGISYYDINPFYGDIYLSPDVVATLRGKFLSYGQMGVHVGDFKDTGEPYLMKPDADGLVSAVMKVNAFKPYVGAGYMYELGQGWKVSADLGVLIWGGKPQVITHEGVDIANDVVNVSGQIGDYIDVISKFGVYPVLNFKISKRIF